MSTELRRHHIPHGASDRAALAMTKLFRGLADAFFVSRYGHRAVVLETIAAVPGMVGGMLNHLRSLRRMGDDGGWIKTLLDEAENERMHLMTFVALYRPTTFERLLLIVAQGVFFGYFVLLYVISARTAHRMVGYFEEEAVLSYTEFLAEIDSGRTENVPAPAIAIDYWKLPADARLHDVVIAVRTDEAGHRDVNHAFAEVLTSGAEPGGRAPTA
ncbi:MAG: alternative oxidase [Gammaproteobacteria bacterium]